MAAEVLKTDSGQNVFIDLLKNGGGQAIMTAGLLFAFNMNLGDKIASDMKASNAEMKASIVVLTDKTGSKDASIQKLEASMIEKLSTRTGASIQKLEASNAEIKASIVVLTDKTYSIEKRATKIDAGIHKLEASIEKLSGKREARYGNLFGNMNAETDDKLASKTKATSADKFASGTKVTMGELVTGNGEALRSGGTDDSFVNLQSDIQDTDCGGGGACTLDDEDKNLISVQGL